METLISQRLTTFIKRNHLTKKNFAKTIGVSEQKMTYWTKGERKWADVSDIEMIISAYPQISRDWLYGGEGAITRTAQAASEVNDEQAHYGYIPRKVYDDMLLKWNEDRESKKRLEEHIKFLESLINPVEKKRAC